MTSTKPLLTILEAADYLSIGKSKLKQMLSDPDLAFPRIRIGDRVLIPMAKLDQWIAAKAEADTPVPLGLRRRT